MGLHPVDVFRLLRVYAGFVRYCPGGNYWWGKIKFGNREIIRFSSNPLNLADILCSYIEMKETVQGEYKGNPNRDDFAAVIDQAVPLELKIEIPWTRERFPVSLKPHEISKNVKIFDDILKEELDDQEYGKVDDFVLSNNVQDIDLATEALTQLVRDRESADVDEITTTLIMMMALLPPSRQENKEKGEEDYYDLLVADTSSGAINLDPAFGIVGGQKLEMQSAAARAAASGTPLLNYEAYPKGREVIKKKKKVRQIVAQPYPVYLKSLAFGGDETKKHGNVVLGEANGLARKNGGFLRILFSMYLDEKAFHPDITLEQFMRQLESEGLDEDDKKSWEANINMFSGVVYLFLWAASIGVVEKNVPDMGQVLSHYAWPCIKYMRHWCYFAPWAVASGDFKTLDGNTKRHIIGYQRLSYELQKHRHLRKDCGCWLCEEVLEDVDIDDEMLSRVVGGVFLGDDRLRRHSDLPIAQWIDKILGTKTIAERKNAFYEQGNSAEFCKVSLGREYDTFRGIERVLAKLKWGVAMEDDDIVLCAIQSASLEIGPNERAQKILQRFYSQVSEVGTAVYNEELQKQFGLPEGEPLHPYTAGEVRVLQAGGDDVMLLTAREWGSLIH